VIPSKAAGNEPGRSRPKELNTMADERETITKETTRERYAAADGEIVEIQTIVGSDLDVSLGFTSRDDADVLEDGSVGIGEHQYKVYEREIEIVAIRTWDLVYRPAETDQRDENEPKNRLAGESE
jgi:hypothetical protein